MANIAYTCPCCGAPLEYGAASGKLECASCGSSFETDALKEWADTQSDTSSLVFDAPKAVFNDGDAEIMHAYVCKNCGAELITDSNTTATVCAYCGSPTILPGEIESGVKPELVLPFTITKEQATETFNNYFKGKKLLPNIFINEKNRIAEMRKLYVPYWLFDCGASASVVYDATKTKTERKGEWEIKKTAHFLVRRAGTMKFENIPVNGSTKLDDKIGEALEPFDLKKSVGFAPAVLSGALADNADVDSDSCKKRAVERVKTSVASVMRNTVKGYDTVNVRSSHITSKDGKITPALMPVWLITTEKNENGQKKTYTFAINGQNGELTCDVPVAGGKAAAWFFGIFAGISAVGLAAVTILNMMGVL